MNMISPKKDLEGTLSLYVRTSWKLNGVKATLFVGFGLKQSKEKIGKGSYLKLSLERGN